MSDTFLNQVGLQWSLDFKDKMENGWVPSDAITEALVDSAIAWETDTLNADKFYEC